MKTPLAGRRRWLPQFSRRDILEGAIIAVGFLLYFWVRGAVADRPEAAYWHARDLLDFERSLGLFWEDDLNTWISDKRFLSQAMNYSYFYLHFPAIIIFGIWLYYYRRNQYTFVRDSFLASGAIALVIYWLYPVAPPRELPILSDQYDPNAPAHVLAFFDTMRQYLGYAYDTQSTRAFVNPYAAMPSLHFGWDLLLGIAIISAFRKRPWLYIALPIGIGLPTLQVLAITSTANHFWIDAVAGGIVALAGLAIAWSLQRYAYPRLEQSLRRLPWPSLRRFLLQEDPEPA